MTIELIFENFPWKVGNTAPLSCKDILASQFDHTFTTGWRRLIGCLKLQVIFRKRATNYRALLRKMTYEDKASYDSTPPCTKHGYRADFREMLPGKREIQRLLPRQAIFVDQLAAQFTTEHDCKADFREF